VKFTTNFKSIQLDMKAFNRELLRVLRKNNEKAGQAWIDAAVNKTPIPTWSGASRATFQKLASQLGTTVTIGPIRSMTPRTALGRANSNSFVFEQGDVVGFQYETTLRYLQYNEYNLATPGPPPQPYSNNVRFTPYGFQAKAQAAWQAEANKAVLPNPYDFLSLRSL
jgi:hypothetical protein